jgi:hypothetical protein
MITKICLVIQLCYLYYGLLHPAKWDWFYWLVLGFVLFTIYINLLSYLSRKSKEAK